MSGDLDAGGVGRTTRVAVAPFVAPVAAVALNGIAPLSPSTVTGLLVVTPSNPMTTMRRSPTETPPGRRHHDRGSPVPDAAGPR
jgi:hypothetical protein